MSALLEVGRILIASGYTFTTVTPESHRRVNARAGRWASNLRDVFGWSRPFHQDLLPPTLFDSLDRASVLERQEDGFRCGVRFSTLEDRLFVHSAFPTNEPDAVFFGPDTYRFCRWLRTLDVRGRHLVDVGAGSGAGGIVLSDRVQSIVLGDINPRAIAFARVNVELAGVAAEVVHSDVLAGIDGPLDLIVANPPYMADDLKRAYRDGGGQMGELLSVRIACEAVERLAPGGKLCLYTGSAVVGGRHVILDALIPRIRDRVSRIEVDEIDVDVFGEELARGPYGSVERIAALGVVVTR